uniref:2S seed storage protein-like n=1 Tax=Erigeron canadensis TaxID=72917 RepID=UPI001CB96645|nr:2S seed storage protein-like [Erigeron canadensis]
MAKLIFLALAFTALLAFASAHKTIVTTTTTIDDDENTVSRQSQCRQQVEDQRFNQCENYFQSKQGQDQEMRQMCCQELENVDQQCQCQAVKKVMRDSMMSQQGHQQRGSFGGQMVERLRQKAEKVIDQCNLQISRQECQIGKITTTTIITEEDENPSFPPFRTGSEQCRQMMPQRFNQCEKFVEQAVQTGFPRIMMSVNKHKQQQSQQQIQKLQQQCCNELENVQEECHCDALQKVYEQAMGQRQQGRQQQQSRQGGQMRQQVEQVVEVLKNQCDLQAQQCMIPSAMF